MEKEAGPSGAASKAIAAAKTWDQTRRLALRGCAEADLAALEQAAAAGWHPSMDEQDGFGAAMRERSGRAIEWLMDRFPVAAGASFLTRPQAEDAREWSVAAMLAAEPLGGLFALGAWAKACAACGRDAGAYFEAALRPGSIWAPSGPMDPAKRLDILEAPLSVALSEAEDRVVHAAAVFCAPRIKEALSQLGEERREFWLEKIANGAHDKAVRAEALEPMLPLLDLLEPGHTHCSAVVLRIPPNVKRVDRPRAPSGARPRDREQYWTSLMSEWSSPRRSSRADAPRALGLTILTGRNDRNLELGLERGWIDNIPAHTMGSCENPSFVAWDQKRVEAFQGQAIPMKKRWRQCRDAIEMSASDPREKARLLAICDGAPPEPWTEGRPRRLELPVVSSVSPMEIYLTLGVARQSERIAQAMSAKGFLVRDALKGLMSDQVGVASKAPWLKRLIEAEEIALCAAPGAARLGRPKAL